MPLDELEAWLSEQDQGPAVLWVLKRLSANDTQANGSHQAGPYIPKAILFDVLPSLHRPSEKNPDVWFDLMIDSHPDARQVRAIWYNNRLHGGTRNETRITGFGGDSSALLDPESTGALTVLSFWRATHSQHFKCHVWVARDPLEEDCIEERTGPVYPGEWITYPSPLAPRSRRSGCGLSPEEIPPEWLERFPKGEAFIEKSIEMRSADSADVDHRLMTRRDCEFDVYRSLEAAVYMPRIQEGFKDVDEFLAVAQPIVQRRRARGGRSLELHLKTIFREEGLDFTWQPVVDSGKRPDFLFPGVAAYEDTRFPSRQLRMLAVKSTVRERWTQVLEEAARIEKKHLLTLQEGVSQNQFDAMQDAGIQLVVPKRLQSKYSQALRPYLQTLESFVGDIRALRR